MLPEHRARFPDAAPARVHVIAFDKERHIGPAAGDVPLFQGHKRACRQGIRGKFRLGMRGCKFPKRQRRLVEFLELPVTEGLEVTGFDTVFFGTALPEQRESFCSGFILFATIVSRTDPEAGVNALIRCGKQDQVLFVLRDGPGSIPSLP